MVNVKLHTHGHSVALAVDSLTLHVLLGERPKHSFQGIVRTRVPLSQYRDLRSCSVRYGPLRPINDEGPEGLYVNLAELTSFTAQFAERRIAWQGVVEIGVGKHVEQLCAQRQGLFQQGELTFHETVHQFSSSATSVRFARMIRISSCQIKISE